MTNCAGSPTYLPRHIDTHARTHIHAFPPRYPLPTTTTTRTDVNTYTTHTRTHAQQDSDVFKMGRQLQEVFETRYALVPDSDDAAPARTNTNAHTHTRARTTMAPLGHTKTFSPNRSSSHTPNRTATCSRWGGSSRRCLRRGTPSCRTRTTPLPHAQIQTHIHTRARGLQWRP